MQQLRFYSPQWLYMFRVTISPIIRSTYAYMATGNPAHCKLTIASVITICFEHNQLYLIAKTTVLKQYWLLCSKHIVITDAIVNLQ